MQSSLILSILLCLTITAYYGAAQEPQGKFWNANDIVDKILHRIRKVLIKDGYDPMHLPDQHNAFNDLGLFGKLDLTDCKLYNLSTVYRNDNVTSHREELNIIMETTFGFDNIRMNCSYHASLFGLIGKKGKVVVNLPHLKADATVDVVVNKMKVALKSLHLVNDGAIDVHLEGSAVDKLLSILTKNVSNIFKETILNEVEVQVTKKIQEILDENSAMFRKKMQKTSLKLADSISLAALHAFLLL